MTLSALIAAAQSGDTIHVPAGLNPPVTLNKPLTLVGGANGGQLAGLKIGAAGSGSRVSGLAIIGQPDIHSDTVTSALMIDGAHDVEVSNCRIRFGVSPEGSVGHGAHDGAPIGRCVTVQNASHVTLKGCDLSEAFHGLVVSKSDHVTIQGGSVHDIRTSPIVGSLCDDFSIIDVLLCNSNPVGIDHADFIHVWTDKSQTQPTRNLLIRGVVIEQGSGLNILGVNTEDQYGVGFENVRVEDCRIHLSNTQGVIVSNWLSGAILRNVLTPCAGADLIHNLPTVILRPGMGAHLAGLRIEGNALAFNKALAGFANNTFWTKAQLAGFAKPSVPQP